MAGGASGAAAAPEPAKKMRSKLKSLFPVSAGLQARGRQHGLDDCKRLTALKGVALVNAAPPEGTKPDRPLTCSSAQSLVDLQEKSTTRKTTVRPFNFIGRN